MPWGAHSARPDGRTRSWFKGALCGSEGRQQKTRGQGKGGRETERWEERE